MPLNLVSALNVFKHFKNNVFLKTKYTNRYTTFNHAGDFIHDFNLNNNVCILYDCEKTDVEMCVYECEGPCCMSFCLGGWFIIFGIGFTLFKAVSPTVVCLFRSDTNRINNQTLLETA